MPQLHKVKKLLQKILYKVGRAGELISEGVVCRLAVPHELHTDSECGNWTPRYTHTHIICEISSRAVEGGSEAVLLPTSAELGSEYWTELL